MFAEVSDRWANPVVEISQVRCDEGKKSGSLTSTSLVSDAQSLLSVLDLCVCFGGGGGEVCRGTVSWVL